MSQAKYKQRYHAREPKGRTPFDIGNLKFEKAPQLLTKAGEVESLRPSNNLRSCLLPLEGGEDALTQLSQTTVEITSAHRFPK